MSACVTVPSDGPTGLDNLCATKDHIAAVRVEPSELTVTVGATALITATLVDPDGGTFFLCPPTVFWMSSSPAIVSVSRGGIRAVTPGKAYISAHADGKADTLVVTVTSQ